jgi:hypothetical protein
MPLLDHFRPPVSTRYPFDSFHSNWATKIADNLNESWLPPEFLAAETTHLGARPEIDIATYQLPLSESKPQPANGAPVATQAPAVWTAPAPQATFPAAFPGTFEVAIRATSGWNTLVAVIELISEANKDRPSERQAFAAKCAGYLNDGVSVAIIDIVTTRKANMHNELMQLIDAPAELLLPTGCQLYAASYRPTLRDDKPEIDSWTASFALAATLPTMPLRLTGDLFVPVEFEKTYMETCRSRRLA